VITLLLHFLGATFFGFAVLIFLKKRRIKKERKAAKLELCQRNKEFYGKIDEIWMREKGDERSELLLALLPEAQALDSEYLILLKIPRGLHEEAIYYFVETGKIWDEYFAKKALVGR